MITGRPTDWRHRMSALPDMGTKPFVAVIPVPETRGESCEENLFLDGYEAASGEVLAAAREIVTAIVARLDPDIPF